MRCPVCNAENAQGPQCRRCRADLSLLCELEEQRARALAATYNAAARGRWGQVAALAEGAEALRSGPDVRRLAAVGRLLRRDFAGAWGAYRAGRTDEGGDGDAAPTLPGPSAGR
jgi:hypothetical protein